MREYALPFVVAWCGIATSQGYVFCVPGFVTPEEAARVTHERQEE